MTPATELHELLGHAALRGRWPGGFTSDDVLDELLALGCLAVEIRDDDPSVRFTCRIDRRDGGVGAVFGTGRSLTAAALRCLIEAEAELSDEVARGLLGFGRLLDDV